MKNDIISKALTATGTLELEYLQLSLSQVRGIGLEPPMLVEEIGNRSLIGELAVFANAIWA